jgi:hypothetical protein
MFSSLEVKSPHEIRAEKRRTVATISLRPESSGIPLGVLALAHECPSRTVALSSCRRGNARAPTPLILRSCSRSALDAEGLTLGDPCLDVAESKEIPGADDSRLLAGRHSEFDRLWKLKRGIVNHAPELHVRNTVQQLAHRAGRDQAHVVEFLRRNVEGMFLTTRPFLTMQLPPFCFVCLGAIEIVP